MAESVLIILINVSWQLTLIFAVSWLILKIFKIRLASARRVIWLWVVFSPLVLVPLNIVSSDLVIIHLGNFGRGEVINSDSSALIREVDKDSEPVSTIDPAENQILGEQPVLYREPRSRLYEQLSKEISAKLVMPLFIIWSIGTGMGFILLIAGYLRLKKLLIKAHQIRDEKAIAILRKTVIEVGTSRPIRLFTSNKARVPISIGFIHPCVVLPHWMLNSHEKLRMVLIHEISHLKRFDDFINLISRTIGSLFFFHPLFHLAVKELKLSNEEICDGWAVRLIGTREDYADCLVELSRGCLGRLPIGFGENGSSMIRRVNSILQEGAVYKMLSVKRLASVSILAFCLIFTASWVRLVNPALAAQSAKIESQKKQEARRAIEQFQKEARFNRGAIADIAIMVPKAEYNLTVIVHAAYLMSKFGYHTMLLANIAELAASCDHECPELSDIADLAVLRPAVTSAIIQLAEQATRAREEEEKKQVRQEIEKLKATADYKSIKEAIENQRKTVERQEETKSVFDEKLESKEKQEALREIEGFCKEAEFNHGAIVKIASLISKTERNLPVIIRAAYLASKFKYHTGLLVTTAKLAASCDHKCPELREVADLAVLKLSESQKIVQLAEQAKKARSEKEKRQVRQKIEKLKAIADYKSIKEALEAQQKTQ